MIIKKDSRYFIQSPKRIPCKQIPLKAKKVPTTPNYFLQFKPYTNKKRAEFNKRIDLNKLIYKLSVCVNDYFRFPRMLEDYPGKEKKMTNKFKLIGWNKKEDKRNLIQSLYLILNEHTTNIEEEKSMAFFYIGAIFQVCGIEEGPVDKIGRRLYMRHLRLTKPQKK